MSPSLSFFITQESWPLLSQEPQGSSPFLPSDPGVWVPSSLGRTS